MEGSLGGDVAAALSDEFSRRILSSIREEAKTVQEISLEQAIPLSTCYRKSRTLSRKGILVVDRIVVTAEGKRFAVYRSPFRGLRVEFSDEGMMVVAELNQDVAEKFRNRWVAQMDPSSRIRGW